jgi:integrase
MINGDSSITHSRGPIELDGGVGQASLMLAAGAPMAVVSERLGHSTITITSDTYSHLLDGVGRDAAERANALVPRASRDQSVTKSVADEPT